MIEIGEYIIEYIKKKPEGIISIIRLKFIETNLKYNAHYWRIIRTLISRTI